MSEEGLPLKQNGPDVVVEYEIDYAGLWRTELKFGAVLQWLLAEARWWAEYHRDWAATDDWPDSARERNLHPWEQQGR